MAGAHLHLVARPPPTVNLQVADDSVGGVVSGAVRDDEEEVGVAVRSRFSSGEGAKAGQREVPIVGEVLVHQSAQPARCTPRPVIGVVRRQRVWSTAP